MDLFPKSRKTKIKPFYYQSSYTRTSFSTINEKH